jgi:hypothetical protein
MKKNKTTADVYPAGPPLSPKEAALRGRWYAVAGAAAKLDCSTSSIERRAVEWQDEPVPFRFRYLLLVWDAGGEPERRYLESDLEAVLHEPKRLPAASRARLRPRFLRPAFSTV